MTSTINIQIINIRSESHELVTIFFKFSCNRKDIPILGNRVQGYFDSEAVFLDWNIGRVVISNKIASKYIVGMTLELTGDCEKLAASEFVGLAKFLRKKGISDDEIFERIYPKVKTKSDYRYAMEHYA